MKPLLMMAIAGGAIWYFLREQTTSDTPKNLTASDLQKLVEDAVKKAGTTTPAGTGTEKTTAQKFLDAAGGATSLNGHEWSYFRTAVGIDPLTPEAFGEKLGDGLTKMSIAEYLTKVGLSGFRRGAGRVRPIVINHNALRAALGA